MDVATLASVLSVGVALLVAVVGAAVYMQTRFSRLERDMDSRFSRLERRISALEASIRVIGGVARDLVGLVGRMAQTLHTKQVLSDEEYRGMFDNYVAMASRGVEAEIERLVPEANPITREEADTLKAYIAKARRAEFFAPREVEEYNQIVGRIEAESPDDPGIWRLSVIGAFLSGLFLPLTKKEHEETGG